MTPIDYHISDRHDDLHLPAILHMCTTVIGCLLVIVIGVSADDLITDCRQEAFLALGGFLTLKLLSRRQKALLKILL